MHCITLQLPHDNTVRLLPKFTYPELYILLVAGELESEFRERSPKLWSPMGEQVGNAVQMDPPEFSFGGEADL